MGSTKKNMSNWFQEKRVSSYFALLTSIVVSIVIISTIAFVGHYIKNMSIESQESVKRFNASLSALVFQAYENAEKTRHYEQLNTIIDNMLANKILNYGYVIDGKTQKIVWSTNKNDVGKPEQLSEQMIINTSSFDRVQELSEKNTKSIMKLGFTTGQSQRGEVESLLTQIRWWILLFFLIGLLSSNYMGRILQKPFDKLINGVNEFGRGRFEYRLEKTPFKEFNMLVDSYNSMASQLCELYESLEMKVHERTVALEETNRKLQETQGMMVHSEKMRSLGELVAGIAHEINNPINFIHGNIIHLGKYTDDMFTLIKMYEKIENMISGPELEAIKKFKDEIDIEFLETDIQDLIKSCKEGTERTKNIVLDLKNFSRLDEMVFTEFNVSKEIDTTLNILTNKFKDRVEIIKNYAPDTPKIEAYGGQLNQVFMNILDNSIYAIKEKGTITINIFKQPDFDNVVIEFIDNGIGISEENLRKVFDPFYTTKPVGEGTGLGMSIAYKVVTSHGGAMDVESALGKGTTFRIILPVSQEKEAYEQV